MDYEKRYKEALKWMQSLYGGLHGATKEEAEKYFPELKSEDERMRKEIIDFLRLPHPQFVGKRDHEKWIDWLEKQGNKIVDCKQNHQDVKYPNGAIITEDFNDGEGFYKLRLDYLSKKQVEEVEEMVRTWNKESKTSNENIINCIGMCLTDVNEQRFKDYDTNLKDCLAWLEKQGDKATHINGEDYGIDGLYHAIKILERTVGRVTGYQSDDGILSHEAAIDAVKELYKKQGGQEHFYDFNANDWYVSKVDGKIHNMTYNPTDKVKPKFEVGDCVVNNNSGSVCQVTKIRDDEYCLWPLYSEIQGYLRIIDVDTDYHLWTIADAKDGDVLVTPPEEGSESNEQIFLFKAINSRDYVDNCIEYYGRLCDDRFYKNKTGYMGTILDTFYPATKEQRDLLFQKMAEAGYEWDSEKKELKKIEPKKLDADKVIE